jgi:hypothetical protein
LHQPFIVYITDASFVGMTGQKLLEGMQVDSADVIKQ